MQASLLFTRSYSEKMTTCQPSYTPPPSDSKEIRNIDQHVKHALAFLRNILRSHLCFHLVFSLLLVLQGLGLIGVLLFQPKSLPIAILLGTLTLSVFTYLILIFYLQAKKSDQFLKLRASFLHLCQKNLPNHLEHAEEHLLLASAVSHFAKHVHYPSLSPFKWCNHKWMQPLTNRLKHHWQSHDLAQMKEKLFFASINEHIQLIKQSPDNLQAHTSLAKTYLALGKLYRTKKATASDPDPIAAHKRCITRAIEEFSIVAEYAPNTPWVHAQLASCHHTLHNYDAEIQEYEFILTLLPKDAQIMHRLGILYFEQGLIAKGIQIYKKLKGCDPAKAATLIHHYDAYMQRLYHHGWADSP